MARYGVPRARWVNTSEKIPKPMTIQDIELGYYAKRFAYSYCEGCSRIVDGWHKSCVCTGIWTPMKKSWVDVSWNTLVTLLNLRERHGLEVWK